MPGQVNRDQVQEMLQQGAQLVEVLPREEYRGWHLTGAVNIPLKEFHREAVAQLDRSRPVVLYCADNQ